MIEMSTVTINQLQYIKPLKVMWVGGYYLLPCTSNFEWLNFYS